MNICKIKNEIVWNIRFIKVKKQAKQIKEDKIFLVGTPLHGNLGDHAIAKESIRLIEENSTSKVIEIPSSVIGRNTNRFVNIIKDSTIVITGGGFMGTLWKNEEDMVQSVVNNFPNNKIVFFPQTLFFENTEKGKKLKEISKKIYNKDNLYFAAREEKSYKLAKEIFNHVIFAPDIVLRMNADNKKDSRVGCLFCMRKDKEKILQGEKIDEIKTKVSKIYNKIDITDTVINKRVTRKNRDLELKKIIEEFQKHELVITDRLHGMVFAAITKTPCIVFNNSSSKVKGVYQYIQKYTNYIFLCEEIEKIDEILGKLKGLQEKKFDQKKLEDEYIDLKCIIKGGK